MSRSPKIAVVPSMERLEQAVRAGGGTLVPPAQAEGIVWTDPKGAADLKKLLATAPAQWIQLPFAGIEDFVAEGVVTDERTWTCAKEIYGPSCAEHALLLMLSAARRMNEHVRARTWTKAVVPERKLQGSTVLIVGTGGIARELAALLVPFRAHLLAVGRTGRALEGAEETGKSEALLHWLPRADYVVIAAPLTEATRHLFNAAAFAKMKPDAWLVNVARGGLVDHAALDAALAKGELGGAALDVTEPEPLPDHSPLWKRANVLITPHVANTWSMALPELAKLIEINVRHFGLGEPLEGNVQPAAGY